MSEISSLLQTQTDIQTDRHTCIQTDILYIQTDTQIDDCTLHQEKANSLPQRISVIGLKLVTHTYRRLVWQ